MGSLKSLLKNSTLIMDLTRPIRRSMYQRKVRQLAHIPIAGSIPKFDGDYAVEVHRFSDRSAYDASRDGSAEAAKKRIAIEAGLAAGKSAFSLPGKCAVCHKQTRFQVDPVLDSGGRLNWRETTICEGCGFNCRLRWATHAFLQEFCPRQDSDIYITEKFTTPYRWLKGRFPKLIGSEYLSDDAKPGEVRQGIRHEDLQRLSFKDESLDYLVSLEVLEHIPDIDRATKEMARVMRPGGRLFVTTPFHLDWDKTNKRASMDANGKITHHMPIEIHGNPTDPAGGSLCYRHFGWDYLDALKAAGFKSAEILTVWSVEFGYFGTPAIITAVK